MPANLDTPIQIQSGPSTTAEVSIVELVINPPNGDTPGSVTLALAQGDGITRNRIPGLFSIVDTPADIVETIGGRSFPVAAGNYFSDIASAPATSGTVFESVKAAAYSSLQSRYPALSGPVV